MEERWHDPLLLTDVQCQGPSSHPSITSTPLNDGSPLCRSSNPQMKDPGNNDLDEFYGKCIKNDNLKGGSPERLTTPTVQRHCFMDGLAGTTFSFSYPDLPVWEVSVPFTSFQKNENPRDLGKAVDISLAASFELLQPADTEEKLEDSHQVATIDAGNPDVAMISSGAESLSLMEISEIKKFPSKFSESEPLKVTEIPEIPENDWIKVEGEIQKLQRNYVSQREELAKTKQALEEMRCEKELKSKECEEAWNTLRNLENELMRKSMHVGSLAFAVEGQVKEKSKWFSSLRDLKRKLKILEMEHIKLSEDAFKFNSFLEDMTRTSFTIQSMTNERMEEYRNLKSKFIYGAKERKELCNKLLELRGNIRVLCRCRPLNTEEITAGASMAIDFESSEDGELTIKCGGTAKKTFRFDSVFEPEADQVDVFKDIAPLVTSVLDGYNVCIFAYGQTGTGKTFTMEGTPESRGVNFRTLDELFHIIKQREKLFRYDISVSVFEVYNEKIQDLIAENPRSVTSKRLEIRQAGDGMHHVPGLVEAYVDNINEVWEVLQTGSNSRAFGSTKSNEHSSRSHCIHCVMVRGDNLINGECTRSKLWLVDLAGSERVARAEVQGERLKETQNINRSLSALGDVISALATKSPHVPFRNSKLTHVLQDSLGGDSKTLMIVQISPNESDLCETLCSLNFATRVRGVELGPAKRQVECAELSKYKQMIEKNKQELKSKDGQIRNLEEAIHSLDMKMNEKDLKNKNLLDKVKELECQLTERKLGRKQGEPRTERRGQQHDEEEQTAMAGRPSVNWPLMNHNRIGLGNDPQNKHVQENLISLKNALTVDDVSMKSPVELVEKENNPNNIAPLARRIGRVSLCTAIQRAPLLPQALDDVKDAHRAEDLRCVQEPVRDHGSSGKRFGSILRRSLQKKMIVKSPMRQFSQRGVSVVRVSIGNKGRMTQRGGLGSMRKDGKKKQSQKEKERGWNTGTSGKALI